MHIWCRSCLDTDDLACPNHPSHRFSSQRHSRSQGRAMIIGVLNQRGGAAHTTIAVNLAAPFAKQGRRVLLVHAAPQPSAIAWWSLRESEPLFPVIGMAKPTLHREL